MSGSNALADAFANANRPTVPIQSPFELMRQAGENAQLMNSNRLFQANALRGQLIGQATDANGNFDGPAFNRLAAGAGPGYAPAAPAGLDQATRIGGEQQTQAAVRNGYLGQQLGALLDLPDEQLNHGLAATAGRIRDSGLFPPGQVDTVLSHLPSDPAALRTQLRQVQLSLQGPGAQQGQTYGTTGTQTAPGGLTIGTVQQSPAKGGGVSAAPQPGAPLGVSPEVAGSKVTWTDASGTLQQGTFEQYAAEHAAGRAPGDPLFPGGNPLIGGLEGQTETPANAPPATRYRVTPPNRYTATPGPAPTLLKVQQDSVDQYGADSRAAGTYQDRVFPLQQAAKALETAKTGEGSEALQSIASRIQTLTPDALKNIIPNIRTPDEIAAYDEARKYLTMAQQNRPGADRSDAGLATAGASSPSTHISPAAAKLLVQAQLGVERSKQAQFLEFNATHPQGTEGQYARWLSDRAAKIDPRAFITDSQTPAERKSYYDRLGAAEKTNYLDSYALAKRQGLLTLPNTGQ